MRVNRFVSLLSLIALGACGETQGTRSILSPTQPNADFQAGGGLVILQGNGQTAPAGTIVPKSPAVQIRDANGNPVAARPVTFTTGAFGGSGELFRAWGSTDVAEATRLVDICLEAGLNLFDSADVYSNGLAEEILGQAIKGRRDAVLISTKATFQSGDGPNEVGSSRHHLTNAVEAALRRLGTDYIDLFQLHAFDALTPIEEALHTLDDLVRAGKIRYIGCSNFSGWHLMKSLAISEKYGLARHVAHQAYYSLIGRDYEWELMPLGLDQKVSAIVWSPRGWGRLTGTIPGRKFPTNIFSKWSMQSTKWRRKRARPCRRSR